MRFSSAKAQDKRDGCDAKKGRGKGAVPLPLPFVVKSRER